MNLDYQAKKVLKIFKEVFEREDIQYWIDFGSLLFYYSYGKLEGTDDLDIGFFYEDKQKIEKITPELNERIGVFKPSIYFKHEWIFAGGQMFGNIFFETEKIYTFTSLRLPFTIPEKYRKNFSKMKIDGLEHPIPPHTEEYLKNLYGPFCLQTFKTPGEYYLYQRDVMKGRRDPYEFNKPNPIIEKWREKEMKF